MHNVTKFFKLNLNWSKMIHHRVELSLSKEVYRVHEFLNLLVDTIALYIPHYRKSGRIVPCILRERKRFISMYA